MGVSLEVAPKSTVLTNETLLVSPLGATGNELLIKDKTISNLSLRSLDCELDHIVVNGNATLSVAVTLKFAALWASNVEKRLGKKDSSDA